MWNQGIIFFQYVIIVLPEDYGLLENESSNKPEVLNKNSNSSFIAPAGRNIHFGRYLTEK